MVLGDEHRNSVAGFCLSYREGGHSCALRRGDCRRCPERRKRPPSAQKPRKGGKKRVIGYFHGISRESPTELLSERLRGHP
jgi:hypothetical protein